MKPVFKAVSLILAVTMCLLSLASCGGSEHEDPGYEVSYIQLSEKNITFNDIGESKPLSYTMGPAAAENKSVTWKSSDTSIATCEDGLVSAVGYGTCVVRAYAANGKSSTCIVTVNNPNAALSISYPELLFSAPKQRIELSVEDETGLDLTQKALWSTTNSSVATCIKGEVVAVGYGICTVRATYKTLTTTCIVRVEDPDAPALTLSSDHLSFSIIGEGDKLEAESTNHDVTLEWFSTDESVATVGNNGLVTAIGKGTCAIVVNASNGLSAAAAVTVGLRITHPNPPVDSITFDVKELPKVVHHVNRATGQIVSSAVITSYTVSYELDDKSNVIVTAKLNGVKIYDIDGVAGTTVVSVDANLYSNERKDPLSLDEFPYLVKGLKMGESFTVDITRFGIAQKPDTVRDFYINIEQFVEQ